MDYMKWTIVMLAVVFEEFKVFHIFLLLFFFSLSFSIDKRSTVAKIWGEGEGGGGAAARPSPRFQRARRKTNIYRCVFRTLSNF